MHGTQSQAAPICSSLPKCQLHPWHLLQGAPRPWSLSSADTGEEGSRGHLGEAALRFLAADSACNLMEEVTSDATPLDVELGQGQQLHCRTQGITIPLFFAEVFLGQGWTCERQASGLQAVFRPVIAVAPLSADSDCPTHAWLIVADDDDSARRLLGEFGRQGATRLDIHRHFFVDQALRGSGSQGEVFRVRDRHTEEPRALKVSTKTELVAEDEIGVEALFLLSAQGHPNIVQFHGVFNFGAVAEPQGLGDHAWGLMLEWCAQGDLYDFVASQGVLSEGAATSLASGLLQALEHLHGKDIVHRDVKAENILIAADGRPLLTDFGVAAFVSDPVAMSQRRGTPGYCAPEVLDRNATYGCKVDVFGAGVSLYFAVFGSLPFHASNLAGVIRQTIRCDINFDNETDVSLETKQFLRFLLNKDPEMRPSASEAQNPAWSKHSLPHQRRSPLPHQLIVGDEATAPSTEESASLPAILPPTGQPQVRPNAYTRPGRKVRCPTSAQPSPGGVESQVEEESAESEQEVEEEGKARVSFDSETSTATPRSVMSQSVWDGSEASPRSSKGARESAHEGPTCNFPEVSAKFIPHAPARRNSGTRALPKLTQLAKRASVTATLKNSGSQKCERYLEKPAGKGEATGFLSVQGRRFGLS